MLSSELTRAAKRISEIVFHFPQLRRQRRQAAGREFYDRALRRKRETILRRQLDAGGVCFALQLVNRPAQGRRKSLAGHFRRIWNRLNRLEIIPRSIDPVADFAFLLPGRLDVVYSGVCPAMASGRSNP